MQYTSLQYICGLGSASISDYPILLPGWSCGESQAAEERRRIGMEAGGSSRAPQLPSAAINHRCPRCLPVIRNGLAARRQGKSCAFWISSFYSLLFPSTACLPFPSLHVLHPAILVSWSGRKSYSYTALLLLYSTLHPPHITFPEDEDFKHTSLLAEAISQIRRGRSHE